MSIEELQARFAAFRDARDWAQFHTPKNLAAAIAIEAAELQEIFLWKTDAEIAAQREALRPQVEAEVADIFAYLLGFADAYGIDLTKAFEHKMAVNDGKYPADKVKGSAKKYDQY
jgi:dCTP diphosphatase